jgi:hypothetical protein
MGLTVSTSPVPLSAITLIAEIGISHGWATRRRRPFEAHDNVHRSLFHFCQKPL